jgi:hypothetical protein
MNDNIGKLSKVNSTKLNKIAMVNIGYSFMKTRSQSMVEDWECNVETLQNRQKTAAISVCSQKHTMITRSKSKNLLDSLLLTQSISLQMDTMYPYHYFEIPHHQKKIYDVTIDFEEATRAWLKNKKKIGNGCFCYI